VVQFGKVGSAFLLFVLRRMLSCGIIGRELAVRYINLLNIIPTIFTIHGEKIWVVRRLSENLIN